MARTQALLDMLVEQLQLNCGDLYGACQRCAVSVMFVRTWMKDDQKVREAIVEAERVGAMGLQSEAIRRAVIGEEKGVYFKGARVGTEYVKSDGLLQTLLKGRLPDIFGKDSEGTGGITVHGQAQINIMPRASNYDEWLKMKESEQARRARESALPAPMELLEGEVVNPFAGIDL
jgi:hypothetical protein